MDDLRQSLQVLVHHPPVQPVGVEVVAARASRITQRRRARLGAALVAGAIASGAVISVAWPAPKPDVLVAMDGSKTAGYVAERPGGYIASGTWRLTITRDELVIELSSASNHYCGPLGTIQPGDEVRGSISGPASTLRAGEGITCPDGP